MKKIVSFIFLCGVLSSCLDTGLMLVNEEGSSLFDVNEYITIPVTVADTVVEKRVRVSFGLTAGGNGDNDIQKYPDSQYSRLKYRFAVLTPVIPTVRINSFSYTRENDKDTIPCILYYRNKKDEAVIIEKFPAVFTNEIKSDMLSEMFIIFAECSQSYYKTKQIYVNYDIEVGDKRYAKQIHYITKRYWDSRIR